MFNVGRYDPRDDELRIRKRGRDDGNTKKAPPSYEKQTKERNKGFRAAECSKAVAGNKDKVIIDDDRDIDLAAKDAQDNCSLSSSSVPSSSSDDDSSTSEGEEQNNRSLRVIAPEQKLPPSHHRKIGMADEAFDDLGIEDNILDEESKEISDEAKVNNMSDEVATALYMSSLPIKKAAGTWNLAPFLLDNLERDGYERFFPIQALVIPDVIGSERHNHIRARDVCVSAPTGSGKTLAFVLPVLNSLSKRKVRRLRALAVLPSRDLASQVFKVFEHYAKGSDLRVGLAIGQTDFTAEQENLTVEQDPESSKTSSPMDDIYNARQRFMFHRQNLSLALGAFPGITDEEAPPASSAGAFICNSGRSAIDILVATPGRLVDHLDKTPNFTLQHLRFLIIDEADRLVNQSYHNWIGRVVNAANSQRKNLRSTEVQVPAGENSLVINAVTVRSESGISNAFGSVCRPVQLRKLLYSATLTKDPQKLAALGLVNAKHFDAHQLSDGSNQSSAKNRYSMPSTLSEYTTECTAEQKPLMLLALLLEQVQRNSRKQNSEKGIVVVFTASIDSTHRLTRLLQLLWSIAGYGSPQSIAEFSSSLNQKERSRLMKRCNALDGNVSVVVCSDGMSRGMDIPSVGTVINYDVPSFAKTYVHRCGRTARAGKDGVAISVLKGGQVTQFSRMRQLIDYPDRVVPYSVKKELVRDAVPKYKSCVRMLRNVIEAEKCGDLGQLADVPQEWIDSHL